MAKTFYGYAEREAGSYVDWSQIGKDITDMLQEEVVRRETLKKELADASTAYGETLANAPTGLHEGANDAIISFADNAQQARLMQDRLLKSGQLKVKDYLLQRENLTQGTKGIFNVAKNFQEKVAYKVERMKNNESQYLEQYLFELTEGFGNFNKAGIYINPTNFEVSAAKKIQKTGPNGEVYYEMSNDPKDFLTTNEMNNFISVDLDRFDDTKAVEDLSSQVGARLQQDYIYDKGRKSFITRAISDASGDVFQKMIDNKELSREEINLVNRFRDQVEKEFDSWLSNPFNITSTLTESLGEKFTFVWKEEDQKGNPNAILLEKDPNSGFVKPVFNTDEGKEQIDKIKEVWGERLRLRLDQSVTETGKQEISDFQREKYYRERADKKEQAKSFVKDWVESVAGGSDQSLATTASANVRNTLTYKGNQIVKVQKTTNAKGEPVIQMKYKDEDSGSIIDLTDIPLSDKKAYIRAIRGFLPPDVSKEVSDKELEAMGLDVWKDGSNNKAFNAYDLKSRIGISITDPSTMGIEFDPKTFETTKTAADAITEINSSGKGGILGTSNVEKRKVLVEVQNKQTAGVNEELQRIGENPISLTTNSDNQYGIFTNGNNQVRIEFGDTKGLPAAQNLFHSAILKYGSGVINENELRNEAEQFVKDYREAMVENLKKNPQTDGLIIIGDKPRSTNYLQTPDGLNELVNAMKGLATTTGGTTGGAMSEFN